MLVSFVVIDLSRWNETLTALEQTVGSGGISRLEAQVGAFIEQALTSIGGSSAEISRQLSGQQSVLAFQSADVASDFARALQQICHQYNRDFLPGDLRRRYLRIGISTGEATSAEATLASARSTLGKLAGCAPEQISGLEGMCRTGEVLICPDTWGHLSRDRKKNYGSVEPPLGNNPLVAHIYRRKVVEPASWDSSPDMRDPLPKITISEQARFLFCTGSSGTCQMGALDVAEEHTLIAEARERGIEMLRGFEWMQPIFNTNRERLINGLTRGPAILHFSGHGVDRELQLLNDYGSPQALSAADITTILGHLPAVPCLVVFSACHSLSVAQAIRRLIPFTIGTPGRLRDDVAITFSAGLYYHLFQGASLAESFHLALQKAGGSNIPALERPCLSCRPGHEAGRFFLSQLLASGASAQPSKAPRANQAETPTVVRIAGNNYYENSTIINYRADN